MDPLSVERGVGGLVASEEGLDIVGEDMEGVIRSDFEFPVDAALQDDSCVLIPSKWSFRVKVEGRIYAMELEIMTAEAVVKVWLAS